MGGLSVSVFGFVPSLDNLGVYLKNVGALFELCLGLFSFFDFLLQGALGHFAFCNVMEHSLDSVDLAVYVFCIDSCIMLEKKLHNIHPTF